MTTIRRRTIGALALSTLVALSLTACGSDDPVDTASTPSPTVTSTPTITPTPTATSTPTPTKAATKTATPEEPAESPDDDENGELAGQLIIEYPGTPLKQTASKTPNSDVEDLQIRLNEVGYVVATDGIFDGATVKVVKKFQSDNGLTVDGIVGASTWAALFTFEG